MAISKRVSSVSPDIPPLPWPRVSSTESNSCCVSCSSRVISTLSCIPNTSGSWVGGSSWKEKHRNLSNNSTFPTSAEIGVYLRKKVNILNVYIKALPENCIQPRKTISILNDTFKAFPLLMKWSHLAAKTVVYFTVEQRIVFNLGKIPVSWIYMYILKCLFYIHFLYNSAKDNLFKINYFSI